MSALIERIYATTAALASNEKLLRVAVAPDYSISMVKFGLTYEVLALPNRPGLLPRARYTRLRLRAELIYKRYLRDA